PDDALIDRIALSHAFPGIRRQLFHPQRNALARLIEFQNLDGNLVARMHNLRWMGHSPVGHVGYVKQAVDPAQIDECAVFGQVLDHARDYGPFFQMFQRYGLAFGGFLLDGQLARNHYVSAPAVELDDLNRNILAGKRFEVADWPRIQLLARHKALDPDIHRKPALYPTENPAGNNELFLKGLFQVLPNTESSGLLVREEDVAFHLFSMIDHDVDHVSWLNVDFATGFAKLLDRDQAFGLIAKVYNDFGGSDFEYPAREDCALRWGYEVAVVVKEVLVVLRVDLHGRFQLPAVVIDGHYQSPESLSS